MIWDASDCQLHLMVLSYRMTHVSAPQYLCLLNMTFVFLFPFTKIVFFPHILIMVSLTLLLPVSPISSHPDATPFCFSLANTRILRNNKKMVFKKKLTNKNRIKQAEGKEPQDKTRERKIHSFTHSGFL